MTPNPPENAENPSSNHSPKRIYDEHGSISTGHIDLQNSSAVEPSVWMDVVSYGYAVGDRIDQRSIAEVSLHLRHWQVQQLIDELRGMIADGG